MILAFFAGLMRKEIRLFSSTAARGIHASLNLVAHSIMGLKLQCVCLESV